jgi:general stress protein 26
MMTTEKTLSTEESISKLADLIADIPVAVFTTLDPDGALRSRPMACPRTQFDGDFWFFASKASGKIHSIVNDQQVNVAYVSPTGRRFISITGRAEIVEDRKRSVDLWHSSLEPWFPEGLDDPDLVLIRIRVDSAEYWEEPDRSVVRLFGFNKGSFGSRQEGHERIRLRH